MRRHAIVLLAAFLTLIPSVAAQVTIQHGSTLSALINNLYGGNGIQLRDTGHQAHFGESLDFQQFSATLQQVLQSRPLFPIPSAAGLVSYQFNEQTGTYDRVEGSFGPLLAERATMTGRGKVNIAATYTFSDYETFNGDETVRLTLRHCLLPQCVANIASPYLKDTIRVDMRMRLKSQALTSSIVYGLTDSIDVGIVIPYLRNDLEVFTHATIVPGPQSTPPGPHDFDLEVETPDQMGFAHAIGIGDITARAKVHLGPKLPFDLALLTDVAFPSGAKKDFLGTGSTRIKETVIVSHVGQRFAPHLNAGFEYNVEETDLNVFDYRLGSELKASPRLTLVVDLLGIVRPSIGSRFEAAALDGATLIEQSEIDGAFGAKFQVSTSTVFLFNVLTPLNQSGIRPSTAVTFGVQLGL